MLFHSCLVNKWSKIIELSCVSCIFSINICFKMLLFCFFLKKQTAHEATSHQLRNAGPDGCSDFCVFFSTGESQCCVWALCNPSLVVFQQNSEMLRGATLEGRASRRLCPSVLQRHHPGWHATAALLRPPGGVLHRDGQPGRRDQPQAAAGGPGPALPGERVHQRWFSLTTI